MCFASFFVLFPLPFLSPYSVVLCACNCSCIIHVYTCVHTHVVGVCDDVVDKLISSGPLNHNRSGASWVSVTMYACTHDLSRM